ncbi:substrate binding domain of ABC-type glycine betaine transport system [Roseovarius sp. A-2]|uniref:glycine betaine ABC transporter substrate-binding protein n=1 Tax=Roseovarius sp. A-2 TaxID=1570360 RepID=UPI0009D0AF6D|nr:glycine betaine ABC transporter substrate-binding protein [Roseovarius sp. A-2]GAW35955.1 substrate binding domain of ABC-type glycine betaine transport system [Roseovarius sp. A-2]
MPSKIHALAVVGLTLPMASHAAELGHTDTAIKLALLPETGARITAHVAGEVLTAMGYAVEYVEAEQMRVFSDMKQGRIDVNLEVWEASAPANYRDMILDGDLQDMGELGVTLSEGLAYPAHMEATCPGLPDWEALRDCAALSGLVVTDYPEAWDGPAASIIEAMGLPFEVRPAATETDLAQTLTEASTSGENALVMFWRPHWAVAAQDLRFVTLPTAEAACYETPSWGPNPDLPGDCGIPSLSAVKTVIKGTKIKWPAAWYMLEDFQLDTETQEALLRAVEQDGRPVAEVAGEWRATNEETWQPIVDAALAQ